MATTSRHSDSAIDETKVALCRRLMLRGWRKSAIKRKFRSQFGDTKANRIQPFLSAAQEQLKNPTAEIKAEARWTANWYDRLMNVVIGVAQKRSHLHHIEMTISFDGNEVFPGSTEKRVPWPLKECEDELLELVEEVRYILMGRPPAEKPDLPGKQENVQVEAESRSRDLTSRSSACPARESLVEA